MHEPSKPAQTLLERYRKTSSPDEARVEAALAAVLERAAEPRQRALGRGRGRGWAIAAGVGLVVLTGTAFAAFHWIEQSRLDPSDLDIEQVEPEVESEPRVASGTSSVAEALPIAPLVVEVEQPEVDSGPSALAATPAHEPRVERHRAKPASESKPPRPSPAPAATGSLADESRLVGKARKALSQGRYTAALEWADEHERRFPAGLLTEERLVVQAAALCHAGQASAGRSALARLRSQFAGSPALAEVEKACASTPEP